MATQKMAPRTGLTLIELIVVLVILVALAGILVPMLPSMLTRAHTASSMTNMNEINKFVQVYEQLYMRQPNGLDMLTAGTANMVDYMPGASGATSSGGVITARALTVNEATALINAGVRDLAPMAATRAALAGLTPAGSPTFNPYSNANNTPVALGVFVATISEAAIEGTIVSDEPANTGDVYVVFGFGQRASMIGKVTAQPPVHFEDSDANAATFYQRFVLVYRLARGNGTATPTPLDKAIFVGTIALHDDGVVGGNNELEEYYKITSSQ